MDKNTKELHEKLAAFKKSQKYMKESIDNIISACTIKSTSIDLPRQNLKVVGK